MREQRELFPQGLERSQFARLATFAEQAAGQDPIELLHQAESHLALAREAYHTNRLINTRLAEAIVSRFSIIAESWEHLSANDQTWLAGSMLYFSAANDDEPDFTSPIGFEDDADVLNACLKLAHLNDLLVRPEDYDDA
jgi:uncharacterized membrane protein YkvA (DUF1232 family)